MAAIPVEAVIVDDADVPVYVGIAEKAKHVHELGISDKAIARALSVSDKTVAKGQSCSKSKGCGSRRGTVKPRICC